MSKDERRVFTESDARNTPAVKDPVKLDDNARASAALTRHVHPRYERQQQLNLDKALLRAPCVAFLATSQERIHQRLKISLLWYRLPCGRGVTIVDAQDFTVALKDGSSIGFISPVIHNCLSAAWHWLGSSRRAASV